MSIHRPLFAAVTLATIIFTIPSFASETKGMTPAASSSVAATASITKAQATEMALKAHPGTVTKAYEDSHKGKQTWEIKINGNDGKKWEVYYEIATGALVDEKSK